MIQIAEKPAAPCAHSVTIGSIWRLSQRQSIAEIWKIDARIDRLEPRSDGPLEPYSRRD